jgi:hypothetical protein
MPATGLLGDQLKDIVKLLGFVILGEYVVAFITDSFTGLQVGGIAVETDVLFVDLKENPVSSPFQNFLSLVDDHVGKILSVVFGLMNSDFSFNFKIILGETKRCKEQ